MPQSEPGPLAASRILLVEDCPDQSRLYLKILINHGAEVTLECNGRSGCDTFLKNPDHFDLIIFDFKMPELDGLDATVSIREHGYDIPIVGMTAYDDSELQQKWLNAGCDSYLTKPLATDELVAAIQRLAVTRNESKQIWNAPV